MKKYLLSAACIFLMFSASAQWLQQNANYINDTLGFYEMSLPDKNTAWAVSFDGKGGLQSLRSVLSFTRTTDGGNLWTPGKVGNDYSLRFSNISAIDGQEAWVAMHKIGNVPYNYQVGPGGTFDRGGGVFHTTDAGVTWEHNNAGVLFNSNSVPRFVHFKDKNHGVAMGDPNVGYFEVYVTNNKGKKWHRVPQANLPAPLAGEMGWISGHAVIGDTIWFGTSAGRMYKSVDFGKHWTVHLVDPVRGAYIHEIAFLDDGRTGVAHGRLGNFVFVFSTTDGGVSWTNYFQPANWKNSRMTAVPGTRAFVSTAIHGNPLYRGSAVSYDAGRTWTEIENVANKAVCRFYDAETGYAGGFFVTGPPLRGGIFKSQIVFQVPAAARPGENIVAVPSAHVAETAVMEAEAKVYPSPAHAFVNVLLPDVFVHRLSTVQIIGVDGKVLETKRTKGVQLIQLRVATFIPGMYVVRIESNGQTINKSVTIVR